MAKKILDFTVDTIQSSYSPIGTVKQLDSVFFNTQITENGAVKNISEQTIRLFAKKSDGKIVEQRTDINIINPAEGKVSINLFNAALQYVGLVIFELEISDSTGTISTANFILKVQEKIANDKVIENTNEIGVLKEIEDYVAQAKREIQEFKLLKDDMVETNNTINTQEAARVQAEKLREEAELNREKSLKNLDELKTSYFGKEFNTPQERFLNEFEYIHMSGERGSFLPFSSNKSHKIQESIEGKTRGMILEGETLQNLFIISGSSNMSDRIRISNSFDTNLFKIGNEYTLCNISDIQIEYQFFYVDTKVFKKSIAVGPNSKIIINLENNEFIKQVEGLFTSGWKTSDIEKLKNTSLILVGNQTNKEIPKYFEGIKSIGQDCDKVTISSNGKNLSSIDKVTAVAGISNIYIINENNFKIGKRYLFTRETTKLKGRITFIDGTFYYLSHASNLSIFFNVTQTIKEFRLYTDTNLSEDFTTTILIEEMPIGTIPTTYETYKENKKDILIPFSEGLKSIKNTKDEINSITNKAIQRIGKRSYQEGDELLENIITDKINTYYILENPIEHDLTNQDINLNTYENLTYITTQATSIFSAPVTISSTIARLNRENKTLEEENSKLKEDTKLLASAILNILEPMLLPGEEINSNTELLKELNKIVEN